MYELCERRVRLFPDVKKIEEKSQQKIGYARVSTTDQNVQSQIDALEKHGCGIIYTEKVSGSKKIGRNWKSVYIV